MTLEIGIVLAIIAIALYLFVTEKFGIDTVAIIIMTLLMVTGILTPKEGFAGFNNYATITVACMFVISGAIQKSGALNRIDNLLTTVGKKSYLLTLVLLMLLSGSLSAFMNDTAVVALFMPVVIQVCKQTKINPSRLLMPLSFGALLGGICTLIGTSTNILVSGIAQQNGLEPIGMFEMAPAGLCFLGVGIVYMLIAGSFFLPDRKTKDSVMDEFEMGNYLTEIILQPDAKSVGMKIRDASIVEDVDVEILQVTRRGISMQPSADLILESNDVLTVSCNIDKMKKLMGRQGISLKSDSALTEQELLKSHIILVEAIVTVHSGMNGQTLKEYNFRAQNSGATVLAVRHRDELVQEKMGRTKLKSGDVLLISADEGQMQKLRSNEDLLIYSQTEHRKLNLLKLISTIVIVAGIVVVAALGLAPIVLTATVGVVSLIIFKFIEPREAYKAIDWKVIFMLAGVLSLGAALEKTGAAILLANGMVEAIGSFGPVAVLSAFFGLTFISTNFMSNNATAALLTPIAIAAAHSMGVDSRPLILAVAFAASLSFMTPMGYQTNAMIYGPGNYKFNDYLKVGTPLNIIFWILASFIIPYFFPFK
ncbi:MAG: SLC13 family permease [Bacteroidia bacterium]|nr:SLC13 family permease [Bacteroidia bacterium]